MPVTAIMIGHEIDERADRDAQHLGGVAIAGDLAGLDPDAPGEPEEQEAAHEIDEPAQQQAAACQLSTMSMKSSVTCSSAREASGSPAKISVNSTSSVSSKAPRSGQLKT